MSHTRKTRITYQTCFAILMSIPVMCTFFACGGKKIIEEATPPPSIKYVIGPEDVLRIDVWEEPKLSQSAPVRTDGKISITLLNDVQAAGLTPLELKDKLTKGLAQYIKNPTVSVIVEEVNSLKLFVVGNVSKPGIYDVKREINVLQAISMAGGFSEWANKGKIKIFRKYGEAEKIIEINYNKIASGKHPEYNIPLQPGDTIVVP